MEQTRTYLIVTVIVFFDDRICQLISIFLLQNVYYGIELTWVKAESRELRVTGWINFAFCMAMNYYQLITLVEYKQKVLNVSGLVNNAIFFFFLLITLGSPSLLCLKKLFTYLKRPSSSSKNREKVKIREVKRKLKKPVVRHQNREILEIIQIK